MTRLLPLLDTTALDDAPRAGSDRALTAVAQVISVSVGGRAVTVSLLGSAPITLPSTVTSWTSVRTAYVLMDATTGRPVHVLGPAPTPTSTLPTPPPAQGPVTITRTVTIPATWTGTYTTGPGTAGWGIWDAQVDSPRLWQGTTPTGATLTGLALYGRHFEALGAVTIISVTLQLTPATDRTWTPTIQAATYTPTGPVPTGPSITAAISGTTPVDVDLTPLADALIGGAGLALTGTSYGAIEGQGSSMALTITYTTYA